MLNSMSRLLTRMCVEIIFRKADVRKKGFTRGWELLLSHEIKTGITRGFCKGTPSSNMVECVQTLKACVSETSHPMLLPFLILSEEISYKEDLRQRECRDWLRRIEHAVGQHAGRRKILASDRTMPLDIISHDINDCYAKALWRAPLAYVRLIESFLETMELFTQHIPTTG